MKAIKINEELKEQFLKAANHLQLSIIELKKIDVPGHLFFKVQGNLSQDDIFKLGILFARFVH